MHETLLAVFTGVVAVTLLLQSFAFLGIYLYIRRTTARMEGLKEDLLKRIDALSIRADSLMTTVNSMAEELKSVQDKLANTTAIVHKRVVELDSFLAETANIARLEILRIQDVVDLATRHIEETFELIHKSIARPISEISALHRGIKVGLDVLFHKRKSHIASSQDDEMFI